MSLGFVDQFDYDVWRLNFGTSLGTGSGAAGYGHRDSGPSASAAPPSAAVPEPATFALAALALLGLAVQARRSIPINRRKQRKQSIQFQLEHKWSKTFVFVGAMPSERSDVGMLTLRESMAPPNSIVIDH
jgi:hypothetical protein